MADLVSVVVPVYNAAQYLPKCLETLLQQSYRQMQIILVNDGSTDESGHICDEYAAKDSRIEVIYQKNAGASAARNTALQRVQGSWVALVDADDYVSPWYVEELLRMAQQNRVDIAVCRYTSVHDDEAEFTRPDKVEVFNRQQAIIRHFGINADLFNNAACKLYNARLWRSLRFPLNMINEDLYVSHQLYCEANGVCLTGAHMYAYRQTPGSIMHSGFGVERLDVLKAYRRGVEIFEEANEPDFANIAKRVYCNRVLDACGMCRLHLPHETEKLKQLRQEARAQVRQVKKIKKYIDISGRQRLLHRAKQTLGLCAPRVYDRVFLKNRTYI